jgi:uncharacterized membrane protein YgcG
MTDEAAPYPLAEGEDAGLAGDEPFSDQVKYISKSRSGSRDNKYAFVVVGEVYIPGYMVQEYQLHVGDWLAGSCKVAATGARLPYRATSIDHFERASDDPAADQASNDEDASEEDGMPTGALRSRGRADGAGMPPSDDESDASDGDGEKVAQHLLAYIELHGELRLAGPPTQLGCLAHYYKQEPSAADTIKGWELADSKPGVHAFARSFPSIFVIVGRHPNQKIFPNKSGRAGAAQQRRNGDGPMSGGRAPPSSKPAGGKGGGGQSGGGKSSSAKNAAPLLSKAAMEAAMRSKVTTTTSATMGRRPIGSSPAGGAGGAVRGQQQQRPSQVDMASVRDQLIELRADVQVAMAALASAQQRLERLEASVEEDESSLLHTSSAV